MDQSHDPAAAPSSGRSLLTAAASASNADLVRRYFADCVALLNGPHRRQALAVVEDLLAPDFWMSYNGNEPPDALRGRRRHQAFLVDHARNFPDDRWSVEELLTAGGLVACVWHITARHAATGRPVDIRAADFFRVRNGRLAELQRFLDFEELGRQTTPRPADT